jgi:hypothetical protein
LDRKAAADAPGRTTSFLIRLMGSFNKHTPIEVEEAHDDSCKISFAVRGHDVAETLPGLRALSLSCRDPAAIS